MTLTTCAQYESVSVWYRMIDWFSNGGMGLIQLSLKDSLAGETASCWPR